MHRKSSRSRLITGVILTTIALLCPLHALPFRFLAWDSEIAARKIGVIDNSKVSEFQNLDSFRRSGVFNIAGGGAPIFLVANDRMDAEGKPTTVEIKLAAGISVPLVIILPDPSHPTGLRPFVIEDSPRTFAWGSTRFVNATGKEMMFRFDKTVISLPATWTPKDFAPGGATRNMGVKMAAKDNLDELLYSAVWGYDPEVRKLVLIVPDSKPGSTEVSLKTVPENRRVAAADAAAAKDP